jgi:hypothetical protein
MALLVPVSLGELVDKITILEIKAARISNLEALVNIEKELDALRRIRIPDVDPSLFEDLKEVNTEIWDVEDELRECEREKNFGESFVGMARSVYMHNDKRAAIKKKINNKYNSEFKEEKSYSVY